MKLKSRRFECPDDLFQAMLRLEAAARNLKNLSRSMNHQASLFDDDTASTVLSEAAEELDGQLCALTDMNTTLAAFIHSLD